MSYLKIKEYNTYLVDNKVPINIINYVKEINKIEYKLEDINFIDDFIKLVHRKDFCIHHSMLQKYGVLALKESTNHVKRLLDHNDFEENTDYTVTQVGHRVSLKTIYKNVYHLTPNCFKLCAMRSQNVKIYAHYYLLIEISMAYFSKYQIKMEKKYNIEFKEKIIEQDKLIIEKDNKINEQDNKIDKLQDQLTTLIKHTEEILKRSITSDKKLDESHEKLDNITDELIETKEELYDTNNNIKIIAKKLDIAVIDRVVKTNKSSNIEYFVIMKSDTNIEYKYYIIRGQKYHIIKSIKTLQGYHKIKSIESVPNAIILFNLIKQNMKDNIHCNFNKLNLININENDFLEKIDSIYDGRKIIEIDS